MKPISVDDHGGKKPRKKVGKNPQKTALSNKAKELASKQSTFNLAEQGQLGPATLAGIL